MCIQVTKVRSQASDISRPSLGDGDSTDRTSQSNLRKLNFTNTLYQLAYSSVITASQQISVTVISIPVPVSNYPKGHQHGKKGRAEPFSYKFNPLGK